MDIYVLLFFCDNSQHWVSLYFHRNKCIENILLLLFKYSKILPHKVHSNSHAMVSFCVCDCSFSSKLDCFCLQCTENPCLKTLFIILVDKYAICNMYICARVYVYIVHSMSFALSNTKYTISSHYSSLWRVMLSSCIYIATFSMQAQVCRHSLF